MTNINQHRNKSAILLCIPEGKLGKWEKKQAEGVEAVAVVGGEQAENTERGRELQGGACVRRGREQHRLIDSQE